MQKELKIGIAIGAVLLVVLIVYLAVPKNEGTDVAQSEDVTLTDEQSPSGDAPPAAPAGETPAAPTGGGEQATASKEKDPFGEVADPPKPDAADDNVWVTALNTGELPVTTTPPPLAAIPKRPGETATPPAGQDTPGVGNTGEATPTGTDTTTGAGEPVVDTTRNGAAQPLSSPPPVINESAPEPVAAGARTHKVQRGETFSSIAKHVYGEERFYIAIQNANPTVDPSRVRPGTVINLPDASAVKGSSSPSTPPSAGGSSEKAVDSETEYRVESGDSLYKISVKRFGTPSMTEAIYELNKQTIGADSSRLKVGTVLKLPPKPASDSSAAR